MLQSYSISADAIGLDKTLFSVFVTATYPQEERFKSLLRVIGILSVNACKIFTRWLPSSEVHIESALREKIIGKLQKNITYHTHIVL